MKLGWTEIILSLLTIAVPVAVIVAIVRLVVFFVRKKTTGKVVDRTSEKHSVNNK